MQSNASHDPTPPPQTKQTDASYECKRKAQNREAQRRYRMRKKAPTFSSEIAPDAFSSKAASFATLVPSDSAGTSSSGSVASYTGSFPENGYFEDFWTPDEARLMNADPSPESDYLPADNRFDPKYWEAGRRDLDAGEDSHAIDIWPNSFPHDASSALVGSNSRSHPKQDGSHSRQCNRSNANMLDLGKSGRKKSMPSDSSNFTPQHQRVHKKATGLIKELSQLHDLGAELRLLSYDEEIRDGLRSVNHLFKRSILTAARKSSVEEMMALDSDSDGLLI